MEEELLEHIDTIQLENIVTINPLLLIVGVLIVGIVISILINQFLKK